MSIMVCSHSRATSGAGSGWFAIASKDVSGLTGATDSSYPARG
jgi:hypothetical protein